MTFLVVIAVWFQKGINPESGRRKEGRVKQVKNWNEGH
jgi:hypothetical protein